MPAPSPTTAPAGANLKKVRLDELRPGVRLPVPLYDERNMLLLNRGVMLNRRTLDKLLARGVTYVHVDSRHASALTRSGGGSDRRQQLAEAAARNDPQQAFGNRVYPIDSFIHQVKRSRGRIPSPEVEAKFTHAIQAAEANVRLLFGEIDQTSRVPGAQVKQITVESAEQLASDLDLFIRLGINTDRAEDSPYMHNLRVARLAMSAGTVVGLKKAEILELGTGCLIADAGASKLERSIHNLPRRLTRAEYLEITKRPSRTYDMLLKVPEIPPTARTVAYQIHERWDGSGYPRQRRGMQIHPLARIAMVADVFVALVSPRPHRVPYSAYDAIRIILKETSIGRYEASSVRSVLETISLFPIGSLVGLNTGQIARVVSSNIEDYTRPVVEPFARESRTWSGQPIDLVKDTEIEVVATYTSLDDAITRSEQHSHL